MELDLSLLWVYLSIVVPIIVSIVVASIAVVNHLGKRIDAVNASIDDMSTRIPHRRSAERNGQGDRCSTERNEQGGR